MTRASHDLGDAREDRGRSGFEIAPELFELRGAYRYRFGLEFLFTVVRPRARGASALVDMRHRDRAERAPMDAHGQPALQVDLAGLNSAHCIALHEPLNALQTVHQRYASEQR